MTHKTKRRLTAFLYLLMRDELTVGVAMTLRNMVNTDVDGRELTNEHLARIAEELAEFLEPTGSTEVGEPTEVPMLSVNDCVEVIFDPPSLRRSCVGQRGVVVRCEYSVLPNKFEPWASVEFDFALGQSVLPFPMRHLKKIKLEDMPLPKAPGSLEDDLRKAGVAVTHASLLAKTLLKKGDWAKILRIPSGWSFPDSPVGLHVQVMGVVGDDVEFFAKGALVTTPSAWLEKLPPWGASPRSIADEPHDGRHKECCACGTCQHVEHRSYEGSTRVSLPFPSTFQVPALTLSTYVPRDTPTQAAQPVLQAPGATTPDPKTPESWGVVPRTPKPE